MLTKRYLITENDLTELLTNLVEAAYCQGIVNGLRHQAEYWQDRWFFKNITDTEKLEYENYIKHQAQNVIDYGQQAEKRLPFDNKNWTKNYLEQRLDVVKNGLETKKA